MLVGNTNSNCRLKLQILYVQNANAASERGHPFETYKNTILGYCKLCWENILLPHRNFSSLLVKRKSRLQSYHPLKADSRAWRSASAQRRDPAYPLRSPKDPARNRTRNPLELYGRWSMHIPRIECAIVINEFVKIKAR